MLFLAITEKLIFTTPPIRCCLISFTPYRGFMISFTPAPKSPPSGNNDGIPNSLSKNNPLLPTCYSYNG